MVGESGDLLPLIFSRIPVVRYGMQHYYRVQTPYEEMVRQGLAKAALTDERDSRQLVEDLFLASDIQQYLLIRDPAHLRMVQSVKGLPHTSGHWSPRPLTIVDYDDYDEALSPLNIAFAGLGTRHPGTGERLKPGDTINVFQEGAEIPLWEDKKTLCGETTFDIGRNLSIIDTMYEIARTVDGVTTTSEILAQVFRDHGCRHVYVYPNSLPWEQWERLKTLAPRHDGKVRVLWQGGTNHLPDWLAVAEALADVMHRYPQMQLVWWGDTYDQVMKRLPQDQIEVHGWVTPLTYVPWRGHMDCDINLAPLNDNLFNRAKSAIKWYEASALPTPEATLARNIPPFTEIEDGVTGLLYDTPEDFATKLGTLIENSSLRRDLGEKAKAWVKANRSAEVTVPGLFQFYTETRDRVAMERGSRVTMATDAELSRVLSSM